MILKEYKQSYHLPLSYPCHRLKIELNLFTDNFRTHTHSMFNTVVTIYYLIPHNEKINSLVATHSCLTLSRVCVLYMSISAFLLCMTHNVYDIHCMCTRIIVFSSSFCCCMFYRTHRIYPVLSQNRIELLSGKF